jgi:rare lipoprotein A
MHTRLTLVVTGILLFMGSTAQKSGSTSSKDPAKQRKSSKVHFGTASFYANKFDGRKTASGEIFSQNKMTGASNIIAMNTWVRVTNLRNKKMVVVRINDRMHPKNKRLIDLSRDAASELGYTGRGLVKVKVEELGKKHPS